MSFLDSTMLDLEISRIDDISTCVVSKLKKEDSARMLCSSLCCFNKLKCLNTDYTCSTHSVTVELLEAQKKIIDLQSELIQCKEEKMEAMKAVIHFSVAESVKAEFKSYSSMVKSHGLNETKEPLSVGCGSRRGPQQEHDGIQSGRGGERRH